jgi:hypothetical protein
MELWPYQIVGALMQIRCLKHLWRNDIAVIGEVQMMSPTSERSGPIAPKRPKHHSFDESVDEPAKLINEEAVDIEEAVPLRTMSRSKAPTNGTTWDRHLRNSNFSVAICPSNAHVRRLYRPAA